MSELVLTWLNDEVQLSTRIKNFEEDFSNGFLFGELLSKYNQQLNFSEFRNENLRDVKLRNFNLLKPSFRTLKLKFNSIIAQDIIEAKDGVASQILYQLKMVLEKVTSPADVLLNNSKPTKYSTVTPLLLMNPQIEQYATMDSKFFSDRLIVQNRSQKSVNEEQHQLKFSTFKENQNKAIKRAEQLQEQKEKELKDQMRHIVLNSMQKSMDFAKDWNKKGLESWKKNQTIAKIRIEADKEFEMKTFKKLEARKLLLKDLSKSETFKDISQFEDALKKKGLGVPDQEENEAIQKKEFKHSVSATATMKRIKEKSQVNDFLSKERDKRRRKMIVDQAKLQRDIDVRKRKELLLQKLEQRSKQEKEIEYEIWRALQCKEIIEQNRKLRDSKYRRKNEITIINSKHKEDLLLTTLREENTIEIGSRINRQREIEIREAQENRKDSYNDCFILVDKLIQLSEICFTQQQQLDKEDMTGHFFNDEIKLFILNQFNLLESKEWEKPEPSPKQDELIEEENQAENEEEQESAQNEISNHIQYLEEQEKSQLETKTFLSQQELADYLSGKGDWYWQPKDNASNKPQNPLTQALPGNSIEDIPIINCGENNWLFGDMIVELLKAHYVDVIKEAKKVFINHLDWLPIKIAMLGYYFSGKKKLGQLLATKYGLTELSVDELIQNLLKLKKEDEQNLSQEDKELADFIESCLYKGKDIPDDCYVKLIMKQVNLIHPEITQEQFLDQYSNMKLAVPDHSKIETETKAIIQDLQLSHDKEQSIIKQMHQPSHKFTKGFILLDFPHTYEQASLLEKQLSGFVPKDEKIINEYDSMINQSAVLVKPTQVDLIPRDLIKPGLDLVFHINITKRESIRRSIGRRYDPLTKSHYHLDDYPPPIDSAPLIERLEEIKETHPSDFGTIDKNCDLDCNITSLKEWYSLFGMEYKAPVVEENHETDNNDNLHESGQPQITENPLPSGKSNKDSSQPKEIVPQQTLNQEDLKLPSDRKIKNNSRGKSRENQDKVVEKGGENKLNENAPTIQEVPTNDIIQEIHQQEIKAEKIISWQAEKIISWQEENGDQSIDKVLQKVDETVDKIISIKEQKYQEIKQKLEAIEEQKKLDQEIQRIKEENEAKWLWSSHQELLSEIAAATASMQLNPQALSVLVQFWKSTMEQYLEGTQSVFFQLNEQKQVVQLFFNQVQKDFLQLVQRGDEKFVHMRQYQEDYNKFVLEHPDMCEEDYTKDELHQRVDDLCDVLIDIIENKREEANTQRSEVMKSTWIEKELERTMISIQRLLQTEISRYFNFQTLIQDYYSLVQGNELQEIPEYYKGNIVNNQETLGVIEEGDTFPRLENLIELTFKLSMGEEEVDDKQTNKKGGKAPPPAKKDDKKAPKKGGKAVDEPVEEKKELTQVEKIVIEATNTEKAIFKQRILAIKDYSLNRLRSMRSQANSLYEKLQDWIDYSAKSEIQAVEQMEILFRKYIEEEKRIQQEIQLHYVDVVISHKTLNFLTPPPIILLSREVYYKNKFMISQLYIVIEELRSISNEKNLIESRSLLQLLSRKALNPMNKNELPQNWRSKTICDYQRLIFNLDPLERGYINSKDICTYICLAGSSIPNDIQQENYFQHLQSYGSDLLTKQQFTQIPAWFDEEEETQIELNTNMFDRPRYLKELMFYIHKDLETVKIHLPSMFNFFFSKDLLEINLFIQSIQAFAYLAKIKQGTTLSSYEDLLFKN